MMDIVSRQEAKELGLKFYFTGKTCKHGHFSQRHENTGACVECLIIYRKENKEDFHAKARKRRVEKRAIREERQKEVLRNISHCPFRVMKSRVTRDEGVFYKAKLSEYGYPENSGEKFLNFNKYPRHEKIKTLIYLREKAMTGCKNSIKCLVEIADICHRSYEKKSQRCV